MITEHDGCADCKHFDLDEHEAPCKNCKGTTTLGSKERKTRPDLWEPMFLETLDHDPVNHPAHYCRENGMESIDEMVAVFGKEAVMAFCLCNVWKYRYRASDKNGQEDLKKSDWYMEKYIELKGETT